MNVAGLLRSEPRVLAFGMTYAFASSVGQTFLIALFLPGIKESFDLGDSQLANLFALATLASAAVLWRAGALVDRVDLVRFGLSSGAFLALACVLLARAESVWLLGIALFCMRLGGQGLLSHAAVTGAARYFAEARGKALAIASLGHSLGEAILPAAFVMLIGLWGWRPAMIAAGALSLVAVALASALVRGNARFRAGQRASGGADHRDGRRLSPSMSRRHFMALVPLFIAAPLVVTALVFHQAVIATRLGFSFQWFAISFTGFAVSKIAAAMLAGQVADRYGARLPFLLHLLPLGAGIAVLAGGDGVWGPPVYWVLAGVTAGFGSTLQTAVLAETVPSHRLGAVRAAFASFMIFGTALGPSVYGLLLEMAVPVRAILWGTVVAMLAASGAALAMVRQKP